MFKVLNIGEPLPPLDGVTYSPDMMDGEWDCIVSYRYRKIIPKDIWNYTRCVNLHTSYLPLNRGAYPNFFSHWDGTKSGVTIHLIDAPGLDTGSILAQQEVDFLPHLTLHDSWHILNKVVEKLYLDNFSAIVDKYNNGTSPTGESTYHTKAEFEEIFTHFPNGWATILADIPKIKALYFIDKIEMVRAKNNVNWMEVLRTAVKADPANTLPLIREISKCDDEINRLLRQI